MQKAVKWLDAEKISFEFHISKDAGIDKATLDIWLQHFPVDKLINTKSTTYRALPDSEKANITDPSKAINLMINNTSLIKRPVWDFGNGQYFLGWDEKELNELLKSVKK